jgi:cystine transport system substrate-binding protein
MTDRSLFGEATEWGQRGNDLKQEHRSVSRSIRRQLQTQEGDMRIGYRQFDVRAVVAFVTLFLGVGLVVPPSGASAQSPRAELTAWQRVVGSGKIRCAFINYAPYFIKNPNTGELSGIMVEVMDAMSKRLDLKIDWVEEVGYATIFEGLDARRYDALCSGIWENASRGKRAYFTNPLFFNAIRIWVRADERRFKTVADLNSAIVRIAIQDGAIEESIAQKEFPKAQRVTIPQLSPWTENLLNIMTKKADVAFAEKGVITPFLEKNPGTLKELATPRPLRVFASNIPIRMGESDFKSVLDSAILEILNDGTVEAILRRYEKSPGELLRVAPPFEEPKT